MKDRVHFFSVEDMSIPHYLQIAENVIGEYENGRHPDGVNDHLELFHICKFVENKVYPKNWTEARISMIKNYHKALAYTIHIHDLILQLPVLQTVLIQYHLLTDNE
mgnify:CR=1 FL=1